MLSNWLLLGNELSDDRSVSHPSQLADDMHAVSPATLGGRQFLIGQRYEQFFGE